MEENKEQLSIETTIPESDGDSVYSVCFSPDMTKFCYGSNGRAILINLRNYNTIRTLSGLCSEVHGLAFSTNGELVAVCSYGELYIWKAEGEERDDTDENQQYTKLTFHKESDVNAAKFFHNDPTTIVSCGSDEIKVCQNNKEISTLTCEGEVYGIDILPDNRTCATGDYNNELRIWDLRSGECVQSSKHHKNTIFSVHFGPSDSHYVATGSGDKTVKIIDYRKPIQVVQDYSGDNGHLHYVNSLCFRPCGKYLVSGSADNTIKIFDVSTKKVVFTSENGPPHHNDWVWSVQFSPDGRYIASGCNDNTTHLWNFPFGREIFLQGGRKKKDSDEDERISYLIQNDMPNDERKNSVIRIRIQGICFQCCSVSLHFYKIFL